MDIKVEHFPEKNRFEAHFEDNQVAFVEYALNNNVFDILHTIVPSSLEGQGIAGQIVKTAYAYAKSKGYEIGRASCRERV